MSGSEDMMRKMYEVDLEQRKVSKIFQNSDRKSLQRKQFFKRRLRDLVAVLIVIFIVFVILNS
ncbi:MAG: hypothetical protein ACW98I_00140 [Candidatus Hodarchaeales archaeon]|jgi:hypothetical protein